MKKKTITYDWVFEFGVMGATEEQMEKIFDAFVVAVESQDLLADGGCYREKGSKRVPRSKP